MAFDRQVVCLHLSLILCSVQIHQLVYHLEDIANAKAHVRVLFEHLDQRHVGSLTAADVPLLASSTLTPLVRRWYVLFVFFTHIHRLFTRSFPVSCALQRRDALLTVLLSMPSPIDFAAFETARRPTRLSNV